ncbi:MAG: hypothetical protein OEX12_11690 [Gammaproteobacteria bacterium]|nr:hypothetical protein [Gammaproteobacteria bacterium]
MDVKDEVKEILADLKQLRDELKLQLHLAKDEVREQWEPVEKKFQKFEGQAEHVGSAAKDASTDVVEAAKLLGEEVKKAFTKIRDSL